MTTHNFMHTQEQWDSQKQKDNIMPVPDSDNVMPLECGQVYAVYITVDNGQPGPEIMKWMLQRDVMGLVDITVKDMITAHGNSDEDHQHDNHTFTATIQKVTRSTGHATFDDDDLGIDPTDIDWDKR